MQDLKSCLTLLEQDIFDAAARLGEDDNSHWVVYWQVDDVDSSLERLVELGGTIHEQAQDSPYGRIATVADPSGAVFKLRSMSEDEASTNPE